MLKIKEKTFVLSENEIVVLNKVLGIIREDNISYDIFRDYPNAYKLYEKLQMKIKKISKLCDNDVLRS